MRRAVTRSLGAHAAFKVPLLAPESRSVLRAWSYAPRPARALVQNVRVARVLKERARGHTRPICGEIACRVTWAAHAECDAHAATCLRRERRRACVARGLADAFGDSAMTFFGSQAMPDAFGEALDSKLERRRR